MPFWKIHLIFDLIFVVAFIGILFEAGVLENIFSLIFIVFFNIISAIFPDIDTPKSRIRKYISFFLTLIIGLYLIINFNIGSLIFGVTSMILIYLVIRFFPTKHRGITHTFLFGVILSVILTLILWFLFEFSLEKTGISFLVIFWGYLSHLILDKIA